MFERFLNWLRLLLGGYGEDGFNRHGYDRDGYDRSGYSRRGFDRKKRHRETGGWYDPYGYDSAGFDADGEHMDYAELKGHRLSVLDEGIWQIDLHGMSVRAAVSYIEEVLDEEVDSSVKSLVLIHGYRHGSVLKSTVRSMDHPRIKEVIDNMNNEGCTVYILG